MTGSDRVALLGLRGRGRHGWFASETEEGQTFVIDVVLHLDTRAAADSDDLADTVDYGSVGQAVLAVVEGEPVRLIETLAQRVADACLVDLRVEAVEVVVHKPEAPMPVAFEDVEVRIVRGRSSRVALALGSNLGDRMALLRAGARGLLTTPGVRFVASSSVYETDPVGGPAQGAYLNAVLVVLTDLPPAALLERAQAIEAEQGRVRLERWGPRTLDIDVLSIGETVSADPLLTLPHPRAAERAFVLVPWAEADGGYVVPGLGRTVTALLDELTALTDGEVRRVASPEELVHEDPA